MRSKNRFRSQGTKLGRGEDPDPDSDGRLERPGEGRTARPSRSDLGVMRTLLIVGEASTGSGVATGAEGEGEDGALGFTFTGVVLISEEGFCDVLFEIESRTRWNLRFLVSNV